MSPIGVEQFERLYDADRDPWGYETSAYEQRKYERTLAALPARPIGRALEMGCSIGVFTAMLAERCAALLAVDFSERAARLAQLRTRRLPHVRVERSDLHRRLPVGPFDLIVCSELLYYWSADDVVETITRIERALAPGASLVAVHWRDSDPAAPLSGDEIHELLAEGTALRHAHSEVHESYLIDRWDRLH